MLFTDGFEDGTASRWSIGTGDGRTARWTVQKENGGHVFSGEGHITASLREPGWQDYQFKARIKLIRGGIHLNYRDRNCLRYFIGFNQTELYLNRTFPCGTHTVLSRRSISHDLGRWYTITVNGIGGALKVYVDGTLRIEYSDDTSVLFGTIGLETLPDSHVHVDDVEVSGAVPPTVPGLAWTKTGGPLGGLGYDVRMRPDNLNVVIVTDAFSGVNISHDGG